jgi:hypothetical protein
LISREWISRSRARWGAYVDENGEKPPEYTYAIMGLDAAELGSDSNVACFRYGGFVEKLVSWGGVDTVQIGDRACVEFKSRNVSIVKVDATYEH